MKLFFTLSCLLAGGLLFSASAQSNTAWPKTITASDGSSIKLYEWQTESYSGDNLKARAAISVMQAGKPDPVFGVAWFNATLSNNGSSKMVRAVTVNTVKLPGESVQDLVGLVQRSLEQQIPSLLITFSNEELTNNARLNEQQNSLARSISNSPPEIIYARQPSILVSIDGTPRLQQHTEWGLETVVNSPFTIIKNRDGKYYLYGGKHWYTAEAATGPYRYEQNAPQNLVAIESAINDSYKNNNTEEEKNDYTISSIIVSTRPSELIQTDGEAQFSAVQGTSLLYVKNTDDDIFMDVNTQQYYVLLSGRWFRSRTLSGNWQYVEADRLPSDFTRIPDNSEKSDVLASVAGTDEARTAVEDAQIPQTAKVDRRNASVDVVYDGDPEFEHIEGTSLQYATNSPYSVLRYRNRYYAVDNGVWFESYSARGPWVVSVERPYEVVLIAPRYPVYHVKYVYIYDVYPEYVYMGYTPGYLNTYICGPTIVYGTGYYYRPWHRRYYFPRPCTWGYNMRYSRWYGWGFGVNINFGWLNVGVGNRWWGYSRCGWWGPTAYRPNYCYRGGYYGYGGYNNRYYGRNNNVYINNTYINYNNNVYNNRRGIATRDVPRYNDNNRRRDWANNNGNYNRGNNDNRYGNRDRNFDSRGYNNGRDNNDGGRFNNRNREYNRPPYNNNNNNNRNNGGFGNGNNNNNNNRNRGDDAIRNRESNRPQREYNPQPENRFPGRNGGSNNSGDNGNNRQPERRIRQYEPSPQGGGDNNRGGGGFNNRNGGSNDNGNRGGGFNRGNNDNRGNGGAPNNGGGRQVERRENNGNSGGRQQGGESNNGNNRGGGNSGRRGG